MRSLLLMASLSAVGALLTWLSADPRRALALRRAQLPAALVVGALAYLWFDHALAPADRSSEPFMLVVNCLLFGLCFTAGTGSSVVVDNGAVWPDLMLTVRHFGGTMSTVRAVVLAMAALGISLVFIVTARRARPSLATPAAALALALMNGVRFGTPLLDCSITFLFAAATAAALLDFALTGHWLAAAVAGVFASHAVNAHPSAAILLPAVLFVTAAAGRRLLPPLLAIALYVATSAATSMQAMVGNWSALLTTGLRPRFLAGVVAVVVVSTALNPLFRRLSPRLRGALAAASILAPYAAGVLVLRFIHHDVHDRYLPPLIAPLAVSATLLLAWPAQRLAPPVARPWAPFALTMLAALVALRHGPNPDTPPRAAQLVRTDNVELPPMEAAQLTLEGRANLRRFAERARAGELGPGIVNAGFAPSFQGLYHDGALRLDLSRRDGSSAGFMLMRPPVPWPVSDPRYFVLYADDDRRPGERERLARVLDAVFTTDPWAGPRERFRPRLHMMGPYGDPVSAARAWWSVAVLVATTLAGLGYLTWRSRPRAGDADPLA